MTQQTGRLSAAEKLGAGPTRVACYLRISTDEEHQPFSLGAQEARLAAFVASQPAWEHVKTYTDQFSGASAERPALAEALRDARLGRYDVLLVYRVDRFARSLKVLVGLLEQFEDAGVAFRSATEPIDTSTPTGRMLVQLLGVFAEFERATIIDRVVAGMERKAARGGWPGGTIPYGLRLDEDHHLAIEPTEFPVVERIFIRYGIERAGSTTIATELNEDGYRTRSGRRFSAKVVLDILRNRSYLGEVWFRGACSGSENALIDPALFEEVQALLGERAKRHDRRMVDVHPEYLLSGVVICGRCNCNYVGCSSTGKGHRYRYYVCSSRQRYGKDACAGERICADVLEEMVLDALVATYADPDLIRRAVDAKNQAATASSRLRQDEILATETELKRTETTIQRYLNAFEAGLMTDGACDTQVRELSRRVRSLRARHGELVDAIDNVAAETPTQLAIDTVRAEIEREVQRGSNPGRKALGA